MPGIGGDAVDSKVSSEQRTIDETGSSSLSGVTLPNRPATARQLIDFRQVRQQVAIADVLDLMGWQAKVKRGTQWRGACPVHRSENDASKVFSVSVERGLFQCFKCGAKGNQLDLYAAVTGFGIYDAAREVCEKLGLDPLLLSDVCGR